MAALGILMIYANRYGNRGYRKHFGIETYEDKRVRAADEKAKKEKNARGRTLTLDSIRSILASFLKGTRFKDYRLKMWS